MLVVPDIIDRGVVSPDVYEPENTGDDAPERGGPVGMAIDIGSGVRAEPPGVRGKSEGCDSRRKFIEGDTARRFAAVGYGS